jgi:hypothetical protein
VKYFMFVVEDPTAEPYVAAEDTIGEWVEEMTARGINEKGDRLRPASEAKTVRIRSGETIVTDGPFTESREVIAGYDILECADLDEAIEVASKHPMARFGRIELRPFWDWTA